MNKLVWVAVGSAVAAAGSMIVSVYTTVKQYRLSKKIRKSLGDIEEMSADKITDNLIEKAVNKSADKKVAEHLAQMDSQVLREARAELSAEARKAVEKHSADIRRKAAEETARQVENLDIEALKRRVCDQAEKHALEKFDDCLDDIAQGYKEQMENSRKLYDKILKASVEKGLDDDGVHVVLL